MIWKKYRTLETVRFGVQHRSPTQAAQKNVMENVLIRTALYADSFS